MGSFGTELVDVTNPGPNLTGVVANGPSINAAIDRLQTTILNPSRTQDRPRGGILYFPPGAYRIAAQPAQPGGVAAAYFNAAFTLRMAPGARFVLDPGVLVGIDGDIEAPPSTIFALGEGARVMFGTDNVPELLPEWWGAGGDRPELDVTAALQHCIDAAILRYSVGTPSVKFTSSTVLLGGPYRVQRPLVIGREERNLGRVELSEQSVRLIARQVFRGVGLDRATFIAVGDAWRDGQAMLQVGVYGLGSTNRNPLANPTPRGLRVSGVSFDAADRADGCVWIAAGGSKPNLFEDCAFRGAKRWQVLVGQALVFDTRPEVFNGAPQFFSVNNDGLDLSQLLLSGCAFDTARPGGGQELACGILFRAANTLPMEARGCSFDGPAAAMIIGHAGTFRVRGCSFHNTATKGRPEQVAAARDYPEAYRNLSVPTGGVDLYIADPVGLARKEANMTLQPAAPVSPTGYTVDRCFSRSAQFLGTFRGPAGQGPRTNFCPTLVRGLHHIPSPRGGAPAVSWVGPGLGSTDCSLAMFACYFAGDPSTTSPAGGGILLGGPTRALLEISCRRRVPGVATVYWERRGQSISAVNTSRAPLLRVIRVREV